MRPALYLLLVFLIVYSVQAQTGMHLEYKMITVQAKEGSNLAKVDILPSVGTRSEMEIPMPQLNKTLKMIMIYQNNKPNISIQLNTQNKTYTEFASDASAKQEPMKIGVKVVGKEKVGSYTCTHVQITMNKVAYDMWTTREIANYAELINQPYFDQKMDMQTIYAELKKNNADGLMVKMQSDTKAKISMTMELINAEKKELSASLFSPPAGYKKLDKSTYMQQQMQEMMKEH